ncbi:MAG: hypothetical protein JSU68_08865 [Phycisphaerales bacterium]|nr:MAG: hypothetical protein JSU68_08865 [Phycisphaerales bacterium]
MDGALPSSGSQVSFRLRDVFTPDLGRILEEITPEVRVAGEVVFLSDGGENEGQFAIVSLGGTMSPLIVPVDRLCRISSPATREGSILRREAHWH